MNGKSKTLALAFSTFILFSFVSPHMTLAADNCAALLTNKCSVCHNLNRVCQKIGKKSKKRWIRTIKRMVKRGTKLTKAEKKEVLSCLLDQPPGTTEVCK